jgi:hypothetical protein
MRANLALFGQIFVRCAPVNQITDAAGEQAKGTRGSFSVIRMCARPPQLTAALRRRCDTCATSLTEVFASRAIGARIVLEFGSARCAREHVPLRRHWTIVNSAAMMPNHV